MSEPELMVLLCPEAAQGSVAGPIADKPDSVVLKCECCEDKLIVAPATMVNDARRVCVDCVAAIAALSAIEHAPTQVLADAALSGVIGPTVVSDEITRSSRGATCVCVLKATILQLRGVKPEDVALARCSECGIEVGYHRSSPIPEDPKIICLECHGGIHQVLRDMATGRAAVSQTSSEMGEALTAVKH
jgi:hypothetical protein